MIVVSFAVIIYALTILINAQSMFVHIYILYIWSLIIPSDLIHNVCYDKYKHARLCFLILLHTYLLPPTYSLPSLPYLSRSRTSNFFYILTILPPSKRNFQYLKFDSQQFSICASCTVHQHSNW